MYSGSDSNESQKFPQWTLNPATYQNMSNDQVDWAALAQQWIIMKEAGPPPVPGDAPSYGKDAKKEDKPVGSSTDSPKEKNLGWNANDPPPPPGADSWNWGAQNQNWNWNNSWVSPTVPPPPNIGPLKAPLLPTPGNSYSIPTETENESTGQFANEYTTASSGYWTATPTETVSTTKHIKPHNKRYSKVNVPVRVSAPLPPVPVESTIPTLDANKRKQLPAWIREGLEKMERDKWKQLEREKQKKQREENLERNKKNEKETMEILKSTMRERQKSKFESDGEDSDGEPKVKSRAPSPEPVPLTPDELMIKVRRMMTEILLNVTNRHIETICREELQRFSRKRKASDLRSAAPTGGANLSAKLGLGMYGDGSDSSSGEEDENSQPHSRDSDDDLKEVIRKKKVDFLRTEREIEEKLDETDRRKNGSPSRSRSSTPESNDNDSQVDARAEDQKYNQDDYPSPNNKSYEKSKNKSPGSYSDVSDYSNDRSHHSRRSSSSESNDSYKKSKSKYRSKSKSYSPDRRHRNMRWSRSKSPVKERDSTGSRRDSTSSRRDSGSSRKKSSRRSRSRSYSRSRRSRSSSYRRSRRSVSRERSRRTRSRSSSRSRYSSSRSDRKKRRRSRSDSSSRGKRSHRY